MTKNNKSLNENQKIKEILEKTSLVTKKKTIENVKKLLLITKKN